MSASTFRHCRQLRRVASPLLASVLVAALAWPLAMGAAHAACVDETRADLAPPADDTAAAAGTAGTAPSDPRTTLNALVREALERSNAIGAAKLLSEAALQDIDETRAARAVQASVGGGVGPGGSRAAGVNEFSAAQVRATINISQLLYDGGRTDRLTDWRTQLAESARLGHLTQQEQLALTTVALSLERSRYRMQALVYRNYVRKMGCLVEALETITRTDRGRASELLQARKSLQQAELSQTQTQSLVRQIEVRLRRLVGDGLPGVQGLSTVFTGVPDLNELLADTERSTEIAQLDAQAAAARRYADAVASGNKPQLSWNASGAAAAGAGNFNNTGNNSNSNTRSGQYAVGLMVTIPLLNPGVAPASEAARKRAQAATLQRAEALESRRFRVAEVHEQTLASLDRASRTAAVLRDSEQVRNFTLQQWQQLGKRSLFDVMAAESEHYNLRIAYVNALHDVQQLNANLLSLGRGVIEWLR